MAEHASRPRGMIGGWPPLALSVARDAANRVATVVRTMMRSQFTPGAQRALDAAARWASTADADELALPEVLLGLMDEPECRAAIWLAQQGIGAESVQRQFSSLRQAEAPDPARASRFSRELSHALQTAESLIWAHPKPLVLATEHILLGIAAAESDVARWLKQHGMDSARLEAEIHRLMGHDPNPLPIDVDEPVLEVESGLQEQAIVEALRPSDRPTSAGPQGSQQPPSLSPRESIGLLRMMDAAANRAGEGLRVIEDYVRFVLDDRFLTAQVKLLRHDLTSTLGALDADSRHAARETQADVGTLLTTPSEQARASAASLAAASFKRVEQALRSLEESAKALTPEIAGKLEQLRYRTYTLERAIDITRSSAERLATARLYVLVDGRSSADEFRKLVSALVHAGAHIIQLRDKKLPDRELLARARLLREATLGSQALFIMNDRPDLAALSGADGVHVGQDEVSVKDARQIIGPAGLIGVSTHSLAQAQAAVLDGANYIGVGPTFPSGTKQFDQFSGVELLKQVAAEIRLPAFAIGGITAANLSEVQAAGIDRIAVSGAVTQAADPAAVAAELLRRLRA